MLRALARRAIRPDHWLFMSWYRQRFGMLPAVFSQARLLHGHGVASAPNPLNDQRVFLRPGTSDQDVYDEIFIEQEYALELGDPTLIVDAGAHIGLASVFLACRYPGATIVAIEPEPANFALLCRNTRPYPNIRPLRAGLWSHRTHLRIENANAATWAFRVVEDESGDGIPAIGIADILSELSSERIDVLKIDIEGSEIEVLGQSEPWIDRIGTLVIELHDRFRPGCTEALRDALDGHLYDESRSGESIVISRMKRRFTA